MREDEDKTAVYGHRGNPNIISSWNLQWQNWDVFYLFTSSNGSRTNSSVFITSGKFWRTKWCDFVWSSLQA